MNVWKASMIRLGGYKQRLFILQFVILSVLCGALAILWSSFRPQIVEQDVYKLEPGDVRVWDPPEWIPNNLVNEALENLPPEVKEKELNTFDPQLIANLVRAFNDHPWVQKVESAVVSYPARVDMKIQFRTPVAFLDASQVGLTEFIELLNKLFEDDEFLETLTFETSIDAPNHEKSVTEQKLVDAFGRELPTRYFDDHPDAREQFPTILTYGPPREYLGRATQLAEMLQTRGAVKQFQISKIHALKTLGAKEPVFFLSTRTGQTVKWGSYERPKDGFRSSQYTDQQLNRNSKEERDALAEYQAKKLERWAREDGGVSLDLSKDKKK